MSETRWKETPWSIGAAESGRYAIDSADGQEVTGWIDEEDVCLLLAAPDLYAACEEFVRKVDAGEARSTKSYNQMKAAMAKARGES